MPIAAGLMTNEIRTLCRREAEQEDENKKNECSYLFSEEKESLFRHN